MDHTILIIDDSSFLRAILKDLLEDSGFEVYEAIDGNEGFVNARKILPDLIILDIMMPEMDGFECLQLFRSDENIKDIPIIMLTARETKDDVVTALKLGANGYITKPYQTSVVLRTIRQLLE